MRIFFASLVLALTACTSQANPSKAITDRQVELALSPDQRAIMSDYRNCLKDEMNAGAGKLAYAGEGCAGVWTIEFDAIVKRVAVANPKFDRGTIQDAVSRFLDQRNRDLQEKRN